MTTKYADCIFLAKSEWNLVEMTLPGNLLAKYAQKGCPTMEYESETFAYMPVTINGMKMRALRGERPLELIESWQSTSPSFPLPSDDYSPVVQLDTYDDGNVATQENGRKFKWDSATETWREL